MVYPVFPLSAKGNVGLWLSPFGKLCNLQCTSQWLCSFPSNNIVFLLNSRWEFSWWPSLSWASTKTVYFQDFGIMRARNCFQNPWHACIVIPLVRKTSVSCCGASPCNKCLEICLQNGSVLCLCSNASNLSAVRGLGAVVASGEILVKHLGVGWW